MLNRCRPSGLARSTGLSALPGYPGPNLKVAATVPIPMDSTAPVADRTNTPTKCLLRRRCRAQP